MTRLPQTTFVPDREQFLQAYCTNKTVLHLGCADALQLDVRAAHERHLHLLLMRSARRVIGVDLDANAIEHLSKQYHVPDLYVGNVEHLDLPVNETFDAIVVGELLEHVNNPGLFLDSVSRYISPTTELVLTTPNLLSLKMFLHTLWRNERVHSDHSVGFTFSLLRTLLERHGYQIIRYLTTVERFSSRRNVRANQLLGNIFTLLPYYGDTIMVIARRPASSESTTAASERGM